MDSATVQIQDNMFVDLAYVLTVENERAERVEKKPNSVQFVQGRKQVVPGLEQQLYGMAIGEEKDIVVPAANGYGEVKPGSVKTLAREGLPITAQAKPGQKVRLLHKPSGEVRKAIVVDVQSEKIVLDFNHPLAGKTLHYHVRVDGVRPATAEELAPSSTKENKVTENATEQAEQ
jgi:FKBP-type peptidyl-prolyl cis-trans isomerase SlyD